MQGGNRGIIKQLEFDKVPPHSTEIERVLLAAMLIENKVIPIVLDYIPDGKEDMFYHEVHRKIFESIRELYRKGVTVDLITLTDHLKRKGIIEEVGGVPYISGLLDEAPSISSFEDYLNILKKHYILRKLITVCYDTIAECYSVPLDIEGFLDKVERNIFSLTQEGYIPTYYTVKQVIEETIEGIERRIRENIPFYGIPTGYIDLDNLIAGFQPSEFIIIAGRASMGKTTFCLNIAMNIALKARIPVGIFSLEMSRQEIMLRMLCSHARVNSVKLKKGQISNDELSRLMRAATELSQAPIYINDSPTLTINEIKAISRRLKSERNIGVIFIDFLQTIRTERRYERREREIAEISSALKALAKELNIPVVALSQLSRKPEERHEDHRPMLADLRESGTLEQDADLVLFIYRDEVYNPCECPAEEACICGRRGIAEIIVGKQRNGPTGVIKLIFRKEYTRFENMTSMPIEDFSDGEDIPF